MNKLYIYERQYPEPARGFTGEGGGGRLISNPEYVYFLEGLNNGYTLEAKLFSDPCHINAGRVVLQDDTI